MTIRRSINAYELSGRLALVEQCIEDAPKDQYAEARAARAIIGEITTEFIECLRAMGIPNVPNCDQIREVEAVLFGYVADANPELFATAEGFGMAMQSPARERVLAQAKVTPPQEFTSTARSVASSLKGMRPSEPPDTETTPDIQVWRQWCADCRSVGEALGYHGTALSSWLKLCGARG